MIPIAYGIDFGTTNSSIAAAFPDGSTQVLAIEGSSEMMPSLVYLNRDGNRLSGTDALRGFLDTATARTRCRGCSLVEWIDGIPDSDCRQMRPDGFCLDSRLLAQVKSELSDDDFVSTHSWAVDFELEDLVAATILRLKRAADRQFGTDVKRVAVGHPVRFAGAAGPAFDLRQGVAKGRLVEAARRAGFDLVVPVPESQAAVALDEIDQGIVVCTDFGGGTFDVSVIDVLDDGGDILALDGVAVGGEEFDAKIFDGLVRPAIRLDYEFRRPDGQTRRVPARLRRRLRSMSGLKSLLADRDLSGTLTGLYGLGGDSLLKLIDELLYGGQAWTFYRAIEATKVQLSSSESAVIDYRRPWIDLQIPISRNDFESLIASDLDDIRFCLQQAINTARVGAEDVAFVTCTGGSSQIPAYRRMLSDLFPRATTIERDPFTSVVRGLADFAYTEWAE
jgi:hypothetical chaperone protein